MSGYRFTDAGDLRGWYDGAVDGTGSPVVAVVQVLHGQTASISISKAAVPGPQLHPVGVTGSQR